MSKDSKRFMAERRKGSFPIGEGPKVVLVPVDPLFFKIVRGIVGEFISKYGCDGYRTWYTQLLVDEVYTHILKNSYQDPVNLFPKRRKTPEDREDNIFMSMATTQKQCVLYLRYRNMIKNFSRFNLPSSEVKEVAFLKRGLNISDLELRIDIISALLQQTGGSINSYTYPPVGNICEIVIYK